MPKKKTKRRGVSPQGKLESLVEEALVTGRKARKYRKSLRGDNFYADKLLELRAEATNCVHELSGLSAGDIAAMAEMVEMVFSSKSDIDGRRAAGRQLVFSLKTTWRDAEPPGPAKDDGGLFPLTVLARTERGYLVTIARQMNGCFENGWYDACAVMMRRLLEIVIIEAFEHRGLAHKIKNSDENFVQLSGLVQKAIAEPSWNLSRNTKRALPTLRDVGHLSAHGRYYHAQRADIEKVRQAQRVVIEEFLHLASLV